MKSTGMVRKVDELGRIVLPAEIRQSMDINVKDALEIFTDEGRIILQKYQPACIFCANADNIVYFNQKRICADCLDQIKRAAVANDVEMNIPGERKLRHGYVFKPLALHSVG